MLLKSTSTPVLQTLRSSSFSEFTLKRDHFNSHQTPTSPNNSKKSSNNINNKNPLIFDPNLSILSFSNRNNYSCAPSLLSQTSFGSPKFNEQKPINYSRNSFRRAFSDSSLGDLLTSSSRNLSPSPHFPNFQSKPRKLMLQSAPSFSVYNIAKDGVEGGDEKEKGNNGMAGDSSLLTRTETIRDAIDAVGSSDLSFIEPNMELIEEEGEEGAVNWKDGGPPSPPMYLASGLGVDDGESIVANFLESEKVEEHYKNLVEEYPCHPLILRNYAQLLQSKGDYHGAEDYYFRATVADDGDGEILSQYAKLVWDLHHDQEKASAYFERAAQAAPLDSHVLAAYASFLWEVDSNRDSDSANQAYAQIELDREGNLRRESNTMTEQTQRSIGSSVHLSEGAGNGIAGLGGNNGKGNLATGGPNESANIEEYYKSMVEADPSNPLFLRNYAHFLYQSKGDLQGAEEYYSRAMLADPPDGEILSNYAKLVWELYQDRSQASNYFELAVQAAPADSNVLAAYASFLWATDDDNEEEMAVAPLDTIQIPVPVGVVASASS